MGGVSLAHQDVVQNSTKSIKYRFYGALLELRMHDTGFPNGVQTVSMISLFHTAQSNLLTWQLKRAQL